MTNEYRVVKGDERTLIILHHLLEQGMSVTDAFEFLYLKDNLGFILRNNLQDKLSNRELLKLEISKQVTFLAE